MADKIYALEVDETGTPTAEVEPVGLEGPAYWALEVVGNVLGHAGLDAVLTATDDGPLPEGARADNVTVLAGLVGEFWEEIPALTERIDALETRLAALEGEPPA